MDSSLSTGYMMIQHMPSLLQSVKKVGLDGSSLARTGDGMTQTFKSVNSVTNSVVQTVDRIGLR